MNFRAVLLFLLKLILGICGFLISGLIGFSLFPNLHDLLPGWYILVGWLCFPLLLVLFYKFREQTFPTIGLALFALSLFWALIFIIGERKLLADGLYPGNISGKPFDSEWITNRPEDDSLFIADEVGITKASPGRWAELGLDREGDKTQINKEGFRSGEFVPPAERGEETEGKVVLFLGDSFTWGASASPHSYAFPDLVDSAGYVSFNTGIQAVDPKQYWLVAEKYIPVLRPDHCLMMFFLGNDQMHWDPELLPFVPRYYSTKKGWISTYGPECLNGVYRAPQPQPSYEASVNYYLSNTILGYESDDFLEIYLGRSNLGTKVWQIFHECPTCLECDTPEMDVSPLYIRKTRELCEEYDVEFQLFLIPTRDGLQEERAQWEEQGRKLYEEFPALMPELREEHYTGGMDRHFNNAGHREYADFVLNYLNSDSAAPAP